MSELQREGEISSALRTEVGNRLRERRLAQGASLRDTATAAAVAPGHLSDIENGRSHASLPVLLRLCRVLHYPLAEFLPRLGGHRIRQGTLAAASPGVATLSHPQLALTVRRVVLSDADEHVETMGRDEDLFAFVVDGQCVCQVNGVNYELGAGDSVDVERANDVRLISSTDALVLLVRVSHR